MPEVYLVWLENWRSKEHISIGVFSDYDKAERAAIAASDYWNADIDDDTYTFSIVQVSIDALPNYLPKV